ncbi:MAG: nitrophenyl compound nitroreductase subunit ArsF family protein [Myxococcota bacterium]|jgi:hypothetical protein|nr:nitrophenyl compound nitroreductase subunit ArsF family protein [Myxococcota bacterium]
MKMSMFHKIILGLVLLLTFVGPMGVLGCNTKANAADSEGAPKAAEPAPAKVTKGPTASVQDGVVVFYFHGERRCRTCLGIQAGIEKTVAEKFGAEQGAGVLEYKEINIEDEANKSHVDRYKLASSTMIVSSVKAGKELKWTQGDDVWLHAHDEAKLTAYVETQIRAGLKAAGK